MQRARQYLWIILAAGLMFMSVGCRMGQESAPTYRTVSTEPFRNTDEAIRENQLGLDFLGRGDLDKAAEAFQRALTANVDFGPAHNNLGKVHFKRGDLYKAAWEFERAGKLLPRNPQPLNNLGLVYEKSREYDKAAEQFRKAMKLEPTAMEYQANLARVLVRQGQKTQELRTLLEKILENDTRPEWQLWARRQLADF